MKIISMLSLLIISVYFTGTCYALTPDQGRSPQKTSMVQLYGTPAALTPTLQLDTRVTLTAPRLAPLTSQTIIVDSRGSGGAARFAAESFGEAANSAASGDGIGFGVYMILGVVGVALAILFLLMESDDDSAGYKKSRLPSPGMLSFSF